MARYMRLNFLYNAISGANVRIGTSIRWGGVAANTPKMTILSLGTGAYLPLVERVFHST
jgi:hypothetical protein